MVKTTTKKRLNQLILLVLLFSPFIFFYYLSKGNHQFSDLPIYGKVSHIPFFTTQENNDIIILEWTKNDTHLRTVYDKIFSKRKNFYFISYFHFSNVLSLTNSQNYKERIKIPLENWEWIYPQEKEFLNLFKEFIPFFEAKNLDFYNSTRLYTLLDGQLQIRGIYEEKNLKTLEEDLRLLHKKSIKK